MIEGHSAKVLGSLALALVLLTAGPASAYIGPGAGLTAIGTFFGVVGAIVLLIVGFLWYPVKRMLRKNKQQPAMTKSDTPQQQP